MDRQASTFGYDLMIYHGLWCTLLPQRSTGTHMVVPRGSLGLECQRVELTWCEIAGSGSFAAVESGCHLA